MMIKRGREGEGKKGRGEEGKSEILVPTVLRGNAPSKTLRVAGAGRGSREKEGAVR